MHYSGAGNTFYIADNRTLKLQGADAVPLCNAYRTDGLLLAETSSVADMRMRIFNRDGSEAEMCGNGLRCFVDFLYRIGIERTVYHIETVAGIQKGCFRHGQISVVHPPVQQVSFNILEEWHFVDTGVPHVITFVEDVDQVAVEDVGSRMRHLPLFAPKGTNVDFVTINDQELWIRTYERGVEAETLACGSGCAAAAFVAYKLYNLPLPITCHVQSQERLLVNFDPITEEVIVQGTAIRLHPKTNT